MFFHLEDNQWKREGIDLFFTGNPKTCNMAGCWCCTRREDCKIPSQETKRMNEGMQKIPYE